MRCGNLFRRAAGGNLDEKRVCTFMQAVGRVSTAILRLLNYAPSGCLFFLMPVLHQRDERRAMRAAAIGQQRHRRGTASIYSRRDVMRGTLQCNRRRRLEEHPPLVRIFPFELTTRRITIRS